MSGGSLIADERRATRKMRRRWLRVWLTAALGTLLLNVFVTMWFITTIDGDNGIDVHITRFVAYGTTGVLTYRLVVEWRRRHRIQRLWTLWSLIHDRISTMHYGVIYRNIITGYCVIRTRGNAMTEIIGVVAESDIHEVLRWSAFGSGIDSGDDDDRDEIDALYLSFDHAITTLMAYRIWMQTPTSHIMRVIIPIRLDGHVWHLAKIPTDTTGFRQILNVLRRIRILSRLGLLYADEVELRDVLESVHGAVPLNPPTENAVNTR